MTFCDNSYLFRAQRALDYVKRRLRVGFMQSIFDRRRKPFAKSDSFVSLSGSVERSLDLQERWLRYCHMPSILDRRRRLSHSQNLTRMSLCGSAERALDPVRRRLRVGYMSSDFGGHTVGSLIRNLLKMHNRHRVEIYGIGMMKGDGTEWNVEMERSTDKFVSIFGMTDHAAAFAVDACEVHILLDLNGHSKGSRYLLCFLSYRYMSTL